MFYVLHAIANICNNTVSSEAPVRSASLSWPSADVQDVLIINDTTQSFKCQTLKIFFTVLMTTVASMIHLF